MKGAIILGLLLTATVASMGIISASAANNGDLDQTRDRTKDCLQNKDCLQIQDGTCDQIKDQLRTKLQIRDC